MLDRAQKNHTSDQRANEKLNWQGFKTHVNDVPLWLRISAVSRESNSTAELTLMWMHVVLYIETEEPELYAVARYYDISSKADRGDIFIVHPYNGVIINFIQWQYKTLTYIYFCFMHKSTYFW